MFPWFIPGLSPHQNGGVSPESQGDPRAHHDRILPSGPTPSRGSRHTGTVTRIPGSVDQQAPGVLRSWPWGAQGEVPKDQQNGVLCPPEPDSSCANSFAALMLASVLHLSCTVWFGFSPVPGLHPVQPVPLSLLAPQASCLRLQSSVQAKPQSSIKLTMKENREEAQLLSGLLSDFCSSQANGPRLLSWPDLQPTATNPLPLFIILFFNKLWLSSDVFARLCTNHVTHITSFDQHNHPMKWVLFS